jgi:hypothetical protein
MAIFPAAREDSSHALDPPQNGSAPGLLRRERGVPLPGACVRGAAVRAGGADGRGLAPDRQCGDRVRRVAAAVAVARRGRPQDRSTGRRAGRRPGRDERLLLRGDRATAARDGGRDRVPPGDRARGGGPALRAQRRGARARGGRGLRAHARPAAGRGDRLRLCLRQRGAVRPVHRARPSHLPGFRSDRHRRPGCCDADRGGGDHPARRWRGGAAPARPGRGRRRHRRGRDLVGDPVRV